MIFTKIFDIIPGWLWALTLTLAGIAAWAQYDERRDLEVQIAGFQLALANQKAEASGKLLDETRRANRAELDLGMLLRDRNTQDAKNKELSTAYYTALADLADAESGRLRDLQAAPTGCRCSSGVAKGANTTAATDSAGYGTSTGGLLSEGLSRLLPAEAKANDKINDAYIACRADSLSLRAKIEEYNKTRP